MKATTYLLTGTLFLFLLPSYVFAQTDFEGSGIEAIQQKLSPQIQELFKQKKKLPSQLILVCQDAEVFEKKYLNHPQIKEICILHLASNSIKVKCSSSAFLQELLNDSNVLFADRVLQQAFEETAVDNFDLSANEVNQAHNSFPYRGVGRIASVKEFRFDSLDVDLRGKRIATDRENIQEALHATTMASIIAGEGNSFYTGLGVAPLASLASADFSNIFPDPYVYFKSNGIGTQNHSYGTGIAIYYGAEARAFDTDVSQHPEIIHVFSAGNRGDSLAPHGPYQNIPAYANLTGNYKLAKNVLSVGAIDSFLNVLPLSSRGPAFDGRLKPELVAFGQDGSSGAAAITSGTVLLIQEAFQLRYPDSLPPQDLVKSLLFSGAEDIHSPGPDFISGCGNLNTHASLEILEADQYLSGSISQGELIEFPLQIPPNQTELTVTLVWTDPAAPINATKALVNDLDLELWNPANSQIYYPMVLNTSPDADSLTLGAEAGVDSLNNHEQIRIKGVEGNYVLRVRGKRIPSGYQAFSVAYNFANSDSFQWTYPSSSDRLAVENQPMIRWEKREGKGEIQFKYTNEDIWTVLREEQELSTGFYQASFKDTLAQAQLRMLIGNESFVSDTFGLSPIPSINMEVKCGEEVVLSWEAIQGAIAYEILNFQDINLMKVDEVEDTRYALAESDYTEKYFAVRPLLVNGSSGLQSQLVNLDFLNAPCYGEIFVARENGDEISLEIDLASVFQIKSLDFDKWDGENYQDLLEVDSPADLRIREADKNPQNGLNAYRLRIVLEDDRLAGELFTSLLYVAPENFLIYPNPQIEGGDFFLLSNIGGEALIRIYSLKGEEVLLQSIFSDFTELDITDLTPGIYAYEIIRRDVRVQQGKLQVIPE